MDPDISAYNVYRPSSKDQKVGGKGGGKEGETSVCRSEGGFSLVKSIRGFLQCKEPTSTYSLCLFSILVNKY